MTIEVRCPDCQEAWRVDGRAAGGEMICPSCLTRIKLDAHAGPQESVEPAMPAASAPDPHDAGTELAAEQVVPSEGGESQQVVCPRCQLHFQPHHHTRTVPVGTKKTVLVVEDQEYFREIARDALSPTYVVRLAASSDEARDGLKHGDIDLLVLDLTLDGCEAGIQLLKELAPKPCPVLIFTAQDESELYGDRWEELRRAGADDVVIKGMQVSESLARKAGQLLGTPVEEVDAGG